MFSYKLRGTRVSVPVEMVVELYIPSQPEATDELDLKTQPALSKSRNPVRSLKSRQKLDEGRVDSKRNETSRDHSKKILVEPFLKSREGRQIMVSYADQLKVYLEQNKVYPRSALKLGHTGIVRIKLQINANGTFGEIQIVSPSPFHTLNQAAIDLLRQLGRFKPLPSNFEGEEEFIVPIAYRLRGDH